MSLHVALALIVAAFVAGMVLVAYRAAWLAQRRSERRFWADQRRQRDYAIAEGKRWSR